jgi:hypothetical protein
MGRKVHAIAVFFLRSDLSLFRPNPRQFIGGRVSQICVWRIADSGEISNSPHTGERFYEAELCRQKGELLFRSYREGSELIDSARSSRSCEIERCFLTRSPSRVANKRNGLSLRAATSLARFWRHQGRKREAQTMQRSLTTGSLKVSRLLI